MASIGLGAAWLLGCWLGFLVAPGPRAVPPLVVSALLAVLARPLADRQPASWAGPLLGALLLGLARVTLALPDYQSDPLSGLDGPIVVRGRVAEPPAQRGSSITFVLQVEEVVEGARRGPLAAPVRVRTTPGSALQYGDLVEARGTLAAPRSVPGYPLADLLARRGVHHVLDYPRVRLVERSGGPEPAASLHALRARLADALRRSLPEPHASLLAGLLLGSAVGLPNDLRSALNATGTGHLVAVSGFNVAVLAGLLGRLFGRWPGQPLVGPLVIVALVGYTALVGAPPSAVRAALMSALAVFAMLAGRLADALTSLVVAAALMVAWDPRLLYDLGFQLSFLATAGLILLQPRLAARLGFLPAPIRDALAVTLAAQIATLPLTLHTFRQVALVAPLANLLVGPAIPPIVVAGLPALLLSAWPDLAGLAGWPAWLGLEYVLRAIELTASLPGAALGTGVFGPEVVAAAYLALAGLGVLALPEARAMRASLRGLAERLPQRPALGAVALGLLLIGSAWLGRPDGRLHVVFLAVPGAEATFVRLPGGGTLLIGDGRGGAALSAAASDWLRPWERSFDLVVLSGTGSRAAPGVEELARRYQVRLAVRPPDWQGTPIAAEEVALAPGLRVEFGDGVWLEALGPLERPDLLLGFGNVAVLLPQDGSTGSGWPDDPPGRRVLRIPTGSPRPELLARADPELIVTTAGERSTGAALARLPASLRRVEVGQPGPVELVTDGEEIELAPAPGQGRADGAADR